MLCTYRHQKLTRISIFAIRNFLCRYLDIETFFTFQGFFLVPRSLDQISLKNEKDFQHFVSIIGTGIDNKLFEKQFSRHH